MWYHSNFSHQRRGVSMDPLIEFWDVFWKKEKCHISLPGVWTAVRGPLHQINAVASKRSRWGVGAWSDNVWLVPRKHWGPPDRCVLIAAMSEEAAVRRGGWIPSLWRETAESFVSGASDSRGRAAALGRWALQLWCSLRLFINPPVLRILGGLIVIAKNIPRSYWYDVTHSCLTVSTNLLLFETVTVLWSYGKARMDFSPPKKCDQIICPIYDVSVLDKGYCKSKNSNLPTFLKTEDLFLPLSSLTPNVPALTHIFSCVG